MVVVNKLGGMECVRLFLNHASCIKSGTGSYGLTNSDYHSQLHQNWLLDHRLSPRVTNCELQSVALKDLYRPHGSSGCSVSYGPVYI